MLLNRDFTNPAVLLENECPECAAAAAILKEELALRGQGTGGCAAITLRCGEFADRDAFNIKAEGDGIVIEAKDRRGLIFGIGRFLRKAVVKDGQLTLVGDITGTFKPYRPIRGHQLGFRGNNNTYDAWSPAQYSRYCRDMMFFGVNIAEQVPDELNNTSPLMCMPPNDMLVECSKIQQALGMDMGIWYPVESKQGVEEAEEERRRIFESLPYLQFCFIPGSDPGDLEPDELFRRATRYAEIMHESHPEAEMWVSAQMPHETPSWPIEFRENLQKEPEGLHGVIIGPNHAFGVEELRRCMPMRYDYRLYPDITHNVRCEYPVHYQRDDWHFAMANTLSRESVNPRPQEFRALHRQTRTFLSGGVSYSEGVNDDCNKMVWSDMDYFGEAVQLKDSLEDYARVFFFEAPEAAAIADALLLLEHNWNCDPAENPGIDMCLGMWEKLGRQYPALMDNWRFVMHLFRARCDAIVRDKRLHELALLKEAESYLRAGELARGEEILRTAAPADVQALRGTLFGLAQTLFEQIGIQLDVDNFGGKSWERGCTLMTIDRPITDLCWLLRQLEKAKALPAEEGKALILRSLDRNTVAPDELYYSFALHGWEPLNTRQDGEPYCNFQGDRPSNDGTLPVSLFQIFDNYTFKCRMGGLTPGADYRLRVTYFRNGRPEAEHYAVAVNGHELYHGKPYGGAPDAAFDAEMLAKDYHSATYDIPAAYVENGCIALELGEPIGGVMLSEFWVTRA